MRTNSGMVVRPAEPIEHEPSDINRFFDQLETRFKSSSTENLISIQNLKALKRETPERMFSWFNQLCKPLEEERPRVMIKEQLKTMYVYQLHCILESADSDILSTEIREMERKRVKRGRQPLSRYDIHNMVLAQQTEKVVELTKLRAVGLETVQRSDRAAERRPRERNEPEPVVVPAPRLRRPDDRVCHLCSQSGHLARNCPLAAVGGDHLPEPKGKRPATSAGGSTPKKPINDRLEPLGDQPIANGVKGGSRRGRGVNPRNSHHTANVVCDNCKKPNHTSAQCWRLHPELSPFPKKEQALMSKTEDDVDIKFKKWEIDQNARERRAIRYEQ